ncbi:glycosyltransferase [Synechococcus sp. RSCCF101]|uniref:glycosyltransferase n=1 Tax=Synechococcus sp. RSCCF101 TaxID=2511069 RepID=UPI001243A21F|nr:glycosyltransferase [Synechococcus sp. RSCCF101]QEY32437.1 glycosyltransferase [Synechococcus sp. RSCCF101]
MSESPLPRLLLFVPTRRRASETFIRANLRGLGEQAVVVCGDERPWRGDRLRLLYGLAVLVSKACSRLGLHRLATAVVSPVAVRLCRRERPEVVLAEFGFHAVRLMELVPRTGLPLIVHFRGSDASSRRHFQALAGRYRRLFQLAAAIVVKSEPMRERLLALAGPEAGRLRVLVSPSGADPELFHGGSPAAAPPTFLAVGRFVAKKGPLQTLEAFAQAAASRPALRLVMVGDGPLLPRCRERAEALGVAGRVSFAGVEPPGRIAERMRRSRALLQHSLTAPDGDQEGSPVVVMEAQLSGLPVVATRHAGIPEVVLDGRSGHLVAEGDVAAMAMAIAQLADDPAAAAAMGACGRERALAHFTVAHHLAALRQLIQDTARAARG